jgi:hypothetical protein
MDIPEALNIVRKLAAGVDPESDCALPRESMYQHPQSVRALHCAIAALEFQQERERTRRFLPANAGKVWTDQEDAQICDELRHGINFEGIARVHNRTVGSIVARLVRLGKISATPQTTKTA